MKARLSDQIRQKLATLPEHKMGAHNVVVTLEDGRELRRVLIAWEEEILSVDGSAVVPFDVRDVVDVRAETEE